MKTLKRLGFACLVMGLTGTVSAQRSEEPEVIERGAHHSVVAVPAELDEALMAGMTSEQREFYLEHLAVPTYTELATGLNYLKDGEWVPSVAVFENFEEGIVAQQGQTKIILSHSLNNRFGSVDLLAADGGRQRSSVFGIAYFDRLTGQSVMIAERKDSRAVLVPPNQVVYLDAFDGDVAADLRYTYQIGSFEQDVILRENPPSPADYGLNPETTVLEVWTEFAESPVPQESLRVLKEAGAQERDLYVEPDMVDAELVFGEVRMSEGKAFALTDEQGEPQEERSREVPTAKRWQDMGEDGLFLIESVDYPEVADDLSLLPEAQANIDREPTEGRVEMMAAIQSESLRRIASIDVPAWGEALTVVIQPSETLMASASDFTQRPGYVLDYVTVSSQSNLTFEGDETYYISSTVNLTGTTTLEGGAVIKYKAYGSPYADIYVKGPFVSKTSEYRPAIFTAEKDNTVGTTVVSGTPSGRYARYALRFDYTGSDVTVEHVRIRYAQYGVMFYDTYQRTQTLRHAQLYDCQYAVYGYKSSSTGGNTDIKLHNVLIHDADSYGMYGSARVDYLGENITFRDVTYLHNNNGTSTYSLKNSLLVDMTTVYSYTGQGNDDNQQTTGAGSVFQTVGAGASYLAAGSSYRNLGTSSIDADLLADLQERTTYPPVELTGTYSVDVELAPTVLRDNDGALDIGYHYPAADYILNNALFNSSAELTLSDGVSVLVTGSQGIRLQSAADFSSQGAVSAINRISHISAVQEQPASTASPALINLYNSDGYADLDFRFTEFNLGLGRTAYFSATDSDPFSTLSLHDCQLYAVRFSLYPGYPNDPADIDLFNNLIVRGSTTFGRTYYSLDTYMTVQLYNNLFLGGSLSLVFDDNYPNPSWYVRDNYFDGASQSLSGDGTGYITRSHNAFSSGTTNSLGGSSNRTGFTSSYDSGPFGDHYISTSISSNLVNYGSRGVSSAGMTHFGILADGSKDDDSVDISFHYVASDSNGEAKDTDGDGIPDYIEDTDGDGTADAGETNWQSSENGTSSGTGQLQVFTMLE